MDRKKIILFLVFAYGISWSTALAMKLGGVTYGSLPSLAIMAIFYMGGPAMAAFIVQKFIYRQSFTSYGWTMKGRKPIWFLYTPLLFLALLGLTLGVIAALGNTHILPQFGSIDMSQSHFEQQLRAAFMKKGKLEGLKIGSIPPAGFFVLSLVGGIVGGCTVNLPFMFGEEFGWRGMLLTETRKMGFLKSNLFIGVLWGLWHAPIILMGHNYPTYPYAGIGMMCLMTTAIAPLFAYVRLKGKSILDACMLHGMINGTAGIFALYVAGANELFDSIAGWAGVIAGCTITTCICIWDKAFVAGYKDE